MVGFLDGFVIFSVVNKQNHFLVPVGFELGLDMHEQLSG
jgi:hypothetical protein